ncbi:uncharacterized protein LOC127734719 isoform X4 [Mytilus californianus]|uniref:uncharacterized protein LOC127734719 isoform X4 n=1 Tax=Mytilus californianus TaxID=6549 RepID=UPI00224770E3|nr:uncharacterized protein LOC127734719 isoform X4 [Mytilus californianus]
MSLVILLFQFFSLLFVYTECCIRSSENSNKGKLKYKVNNQTIPENHRLNCTDNETYTLACLNGGSCFVVYVDVEDRVVGCACLNKYIGNRCEITDPEIIFDQSAREKEVRIGFISGFTALIILLLIVIVILIWFKMKRSKKAKDTKSKSNKASGQSDPNKLVGKSGGDDNKFVKQPDKINPVESTSLLERENAT